jgi:hypothetical protein
MARKTYPETPAEEARRLNPSNNVDGVTAEQVSRNRALNESLTASFGISGTGASLNPNASFLAQVSQKFKESQAEFQSKLPAQGSFIDKENIDNLTNRLSGAAGSALNGASSLGQQAAGALGGASALGQQVSGAFGSVTAGLGGLASKFKTAVAGGASTAQNALAGVSNLSSDISGALNKLTGGNLAGGIQNAAGALSGAAGQLNNVLSLFRATNLPAGGQLFTSQSSPVKLSPNNKDDWRVRIDTNWQLFGGNALFDKLASTGGVVFPYLPTITLSTKANYTTIDPTHNNYPFHAYKNSVVDDISISGDFSCETQTDAAYWIAATTFFKTATKMFFGNSANAGNPPIICTLSGYGASVFNRVPVIIKSFSVDFKDDVNYIKCDTFGTSTWVPALSTVTIVVAPVYNRTNLRKFSLQEYAKGNLVSGNGVGYL